MEAALPEYEVRRSTRARRSRLTVTDDGRAIVVLPARAPERDAADLVIRHSRWLARHVGLAEARLAARNDRPALDAGRHVLLDGLRRRMVVTTSLVARRTDVHVEDVAGIVVTRSATERRSIAEVLEAWFRTRARGQLEARLRARSREMDIGFKSFSVRDQRTRWGSASRRGNLSFSWRLAMCPPDVLDYVVVHELAHLRVAGHSRRFWALVERHYAESASPRRWLRDHHDEIRHALD